MKQLIIASFVFGIGMGVIKQTDSAAYSLPRINSPIKVASALIVPIPTPKKPRPIIHYRINATQKQHIIKLVNALMKRVRVPNATYAALGWKQRMNTFCQALNVYHEARGEDEQGKLAVISVVNNRTNDNEFPDTACDNVFEQRRVGKKLIPQFSWVSNNIKAMIPKDKGAWQSAVQLVMSVISNKNYDITNGSEFYHTQAVHPSWDQAMVLKVSYGNHNFYN